MLRSGNPENRENGQTKYAALVLHTIGFLPILADDGLHVPRVAKLEKAFRYFYGISSEGGNRGSPPILRRICA